MNETTNCSTPLNANIADQMNGVSYAPYPYIWTGERGIDKKKERKEEKER